MIQNLEMSLLKIVLDRIFKNFAPKIVFNIKTHFLCKMQISKILLGEKIEFFLHNYSSV